MNLTHNSTGAPNKINRPAAPLSRRHGAELVVRSRARPSGR
jgi:hypothetical protein